MGAYENPPIIRDTSGQILAQGFENFSKSMAGIIDIYGERKRKEAKEQLAKEDALQANEMKFMLEAQKRGNAFYKIASSKNKTLAEKFRPLVEKNLKKAADYQLALLTEKDSEKRQELYNSISKIETNLTSLETMLETIYTDVDELNKADMTSAIGKTIMYVGDTLEEQESSQYASKAIEGKLDENNFTIEALEDDDFGYVLNISGKKLDGNGNFNTSIKSRMAAAGKGLIVDMEDTVKAGTDKVFSEITGGTKDLNSNLLGNEQDFEYTAYKTNEKGNKIAYGKTIERRKYIKMGEIDEAIRINAEAKVASFVDLPPSVQKTIFKYQLDQTGSFEDFISNSKDNAEKYKENLTNLYAQSIKKEIEKDLVAGKKGYEKDENGNYYQVVESKTAEFEKPKEPKDTKPPTKIDLLISDIEKGKKTIIINNTLRYVLNKDGKYQPQKLQTADGVTSWEDILDEPQGKEDLIDYIERIK